MQFLTATDLEMRELRLLGALTVFPDLGSGTMSAPVSLHKGWGFPVRVFWNSNKGGKDGEKNPKREICTSE